MVSYTQSLAGIFPGTVADPKECALQSGVDMIEMLAQQMTAFLDLVRCIYDLVAVSDYQAYLMTEWRQLCLPS